MSVAFSTELPESTLLAQLERNGSYADCFALTLPIAATQAQFIEAFYTTRLFKTERLLIRLLAGKHSTDEQAAQLALGNSSSFAVWHVAERTEHELLLTDETGRTSSWLMAVREPSSAQSSTRLFFGSAIKPKRPPSPGGPPQFGWLFHALLGLHNLYSRRLLEAAAHRLAKSTFHHVQGDA
jgi:hypothetical protein